MPFLNLEKDTTTRLNVFRIKDMEKISSDMVKVNCYNEDKEYTIVMLPKYNVSHTTTSWTSRPLTSKPPTPRIRNVHISFGSLTRVLNFFSIITFSQFYMETFICFLFGRSYNTFSKGIVLYDIKNFVL